MVIPGEATTSLWQWQQQKQDGYWKKEKGRAVSAVLCSHLPYQDGDAIPCECYVRKDEPGRAMQGQEGGLDLGLYPSARVYAVGWSCDVQRGPSLCLSVNVMVNGEWV